MRTTSLRKIAMTGTLLLLGSAMAAWPQSTQVDIETRLVHQSLFLRGFWRSDRLDFNADGSLRSKSGIESFTLSGIDIDSVELDKGKLWIHGRRVGIAFQKNVAQRLPLKVVKKEPLPRDVNEYIDVTIKRPANGDYTDALDKVFAPDLASLVPTLPDFWQRYALQHFSLVPSTASAIPGVRRVGGDVLPPRSLHACIPDFSPEARNMRYNAKVLLSLEVSTDGSTQNIGILRPAGLGMDERAVAATRSCSFSPATQNGQPVAVQINMELNFQIY